jgi:hypothetical protein
MKEFLLRVVPILIVVMVGIVVWLYPGHKGEGTAFTLNCQDLYQGCGMDLPGGAVRVSVSGDLKPLQAFLVRVEAPHAGKVEARFTMEGMDMGFNLYTLRADKEGVYQARVTLPVCVTGRRDWVMYLTVDDVRLAVPFVTDL